MAILASIRTLIFPNKAAGRPAEPVMYQQYGDDCRTAEIWARQPIQQLIAGSGVTLSPASGLATDSEGNGPNPITISASGGGGGVTRVNGSNGIVTVNPTGPTVTVDVQGYPFPPFSDGANNVGYGPSVYGHITLGVQNTAVGSGAGTAITDGGGNTLVGYDAGTAGTLLGDCTYIGAGAGASSTTDQSNTAVGEIALGAANHSGENTAVGSNALGAMTNPDNNTAVGYQAGIGVVTGSNNTFLGTNTTVSTSALTGVVAIGMDSSSTAALAHNNNDFVLGTSNHIIQMLNNTTGAGSAALGANCPAITATAPYTWVRLRSGDGSVVYMPVWK